MSCVHKVRAQVEWVSIEGTTTENKEAGHSVFLVQRNQETDVPKKPAIQPQNTHWPKEETNGELEVKINVLH